MVKEEDLVMCIVDRIESNTVFVKMEDGREATLIISEIAPGRIKNLREYVIPNKKIVCKILRIQGDHIDLSLRRVSSKEKKDFLESYGYENNLKSAFKQALGDKFEFILNKIKNDFTSLKDFSDKAKLDNNLIARYIPKENIDLIEKIINKKQKDIEVKKIVKIKSLSNDGVKRIKNIFLTNDKNISSVYLAAENIQVKIRGEDYKQANQKLDIFLKELESKAKKEGCEFEVLSG
jgi:translation initiation factor 2 subunit 1